MNLCKEVCLRVVAHLWSTKLAHLSASQFKNSNLSSCNMRGQGKNVLKCVPTHQKWPNYQEFLAHLAGYFCTCEYTMFRSGTKWFIGERAKRARHSQVCSIENRGFIIYTKYSTLPSGISGYIVPKVGIFPEAGGRGKYSLPRVQYMPIFHKEGF